MAKEIERKFLVKSDKWKKGTLLKKVDIKQGYLSNTGGQQVRIRTMNNQAFITIKSPRVGLTRQEYEYEIPIADGNKILEMSVTPLITKTRYYVYDDVKQMWEIDVYKGINRGLVVAELELENEKQIITQPSWIGREVSKDRQYTNKYLTQHKAPRV